MVETDVAPGIHRVEDADTDWYIVEEGGALTIADAGTPASWGSLLRALGRTGRSPARRRGRDRGPRPDRGLGVAVRPPRRRAGGRATAG